MTLQSNDIVYPAIGVTHNCFCGYRWTDTLTNMMKSSDRYCPRCKGQSFIPQSFWTMVQERAKNGEPIPPPNGWEQEWALQDFMPHTLGLLTHTGEVTKAMCKNYVRVVYDPDVTYSFGPFLQDTPIRGILVYSTEYPQIPYCALQCHTYAFKKMLTTLEGSAVRKLLMDLKIEQNERKLRTGIR